jgi:AcrR family transcriptional regulator
MNNGMMYACDVPKLWDETIEAHRRAVRDATLDTTAALVAERGLRAVTMSEIAERTGIGRATLYKYFPDVETILATWHERQITHHLEHLAAVRDRTPEPGRRLEAVLRAFARIERQRAEHHSSQPYGSELVVLVHGHEQVGQAQKLLYEMVRRLVVDAAASGEVRADVVPDELARYCIHALGAARHAPSDAAVDRIVTVTLDGLRPTT